MRQVAKLLSLMVVTAIVTPAIQNPVLGIEKLTSVFLELNWESLSNFNDFNLTDDDFSTSNTDEISLSLSSLKSNQSQSESRVQNALRLYEQGLEKYNDRQFDAAINLWKEAIRLLQTTGNFREIAVISGRIGIAQKEIGEYEAAIDSHQQALIVALELNDLELQAMALNNLGVVYRVQENYLKAIESYEQSLAIARSIGDLDRQINALGNLGNLNRDIQEYETAADHYYQAAGIAQNIGSPHAFLLTFLSARTYTIVGQNHLDIGRYNQAINFFDQVLSITQGLYSDDSINSVTVDAFNGLGIAYRNLGNYQQSIESYGQALDFAREIEDRKWESIALGNLGSIYKNLGNSIRAIEYYEQALLISRELQDRQGEGLLLRNLGVAYASLGFYQQAIDYNDQGLSIARELEDQSGILSALVNLSALDQVLGKYVIGRHEEALEVARALENPIAIADILSIMGTSAFLLSPDENFLIMNTSGSISPTHFQYLEEALGVYRLAGVRPREANILVNIARAYLVKGEPGLATEYLAEATQILDDLRDSVLEDFDRVSLFQSQVNAFSLLQEALVEQDKFEAALEAAERGRGRALVVLLSQKTDNETADLESDITPDIDTIRQTAQQTNSTLVAYSIIRDVDANYELNRRFGWHPGSGYSFNYSVYMWVVSPDGSVVFRELILNGFDLEGLIANTRDAMGVGEVDRASARPQIDPNQAAQDLARRRAETDENLRQLHQILIEPIADLLPTDPNAKVAFIPQGELFLVPFPALKDADGDYLIENHTILTAPSIQVLQLTHDLQSPSPSGRGARGEGPANPLIVGDPAMPTVTFLSEAGTFDAVRLQPLYGARQEAQAVGATLNAPALLGADATEARIKQQIASADLIHLATHGLLEYGDPRQTGSRDTPGAIALAPGSGEDGLLTATEILQMELQAELVVLSACDTGRGRITGDGVIGLSRAFIAAGVPSIIVSLWAVPDAPTADLMTEFYNQLAQGETKVQALRQAMLITMQQHPDPKNWAAFTLIGAAE